MKRTRLKRRSPKHRAANDAARERRAAYLREHPDCELCLYHRHVALFSSPRQVRRAVEVHHLAGRNAKAPNIYERRANYQSICAEHHRHVTDDSIGTAGLCCAAKAFCDKENYDLAWLKAARPRRFAEVNP